MNFIVNPINKKKISIFGKVGKNILKNYILFFKNGGHSEPCAVNKKTKRCAKSGKNDGNCKLKNGRCVKITTKTPAGKPKKPRKPRKPRTSLRASLMVSPKRLRSGSQKKIGGLWYEQPKPLEDMSRAEIIGHLRKFRNAWEKVTPKKIDLSNERLSHETTDFLRYTLLEHYFSEESKQQAIDIYNAEW